MTREEWIIANPWIDPTLGYRNDTLLPGITKRYHHVAVHTAGSHKSMPFMEVCHSNHLDHVDDRDWKLFAINYEGSVGGRDYVWGMFVCGIGAFNVMVPLENVRELLPHEREAWSKQTLGMYSGFGGDLSYTLPSGVKGVG
jgi:hypothetical protein